MGEPRTHPLRDRNARLIRVGPAALPDMVALDAAVLVARMVEAGEWPEPSYWIKSSRQVWHASSPCLLS